MKKRTGINVLRIAVIGIIITSCGPSPQEEVNVVSVEEVDVVEDVWVIDEHQINDIALTSVSPKSTNNDDPKGDDIKIDEDKVTDDSNNDLSDSEDNPEILDDTVVEESLVEVETDAVATDGTNIVAERNYQVYDYVTVSDQLEQAGYVALVEDVTEEKAIIPLDETQTLVSYGKKGDAQATLQVVTDPDGNIESIAFTDKKHNDVYDVNTGMTAKEVKKLRKEMKHMVKKGQVFLYNDESNVMYLMSTQNNLTGEEITDEDIETMEISSIVWKDKNHKDRKKDKK